MRYFTPELLALGQSKDDKVLNEQEELWDETCERYEASLASIRHEMPAGLRHLDESYYLHDAVVCDMGRQPSSFVLTVQLDTPPHSLLTIAYDLVEEAIINHAALPAELRFGGQSVLWQYDEIERLAGEPQTWKHSILFSNGWEVQLRFREVHVQEFQPLIPAPRNGQILSADTSVSQPA